VRLDEVVLAAVREATPLHHGVEIRVARLDDVMVLGDPLGLQQVLVNVLDNALEVSTLGSEVVIALSRSEDRASVTVSDSGPGIAPGERERLFEAFYTKAKAKAGSARAGAGLGLAIARSIARAHGGELSVLSEPGAGATFELSLPVSTSSPETDRPASEVAIQAAAPGRRTTNRAPASLG
jgi:signal transduction histidine kinase